MSRMLPTLVALALLPGASRAASDRRVDSLVFSIHVDVDVESGSPHGGRGTRSAE